MVMDQVVVFSMFLYLVQFNDVDLVGFSQIYDTYLPELKHCLLTSNNLDTLMPKSNVPKEYPTK